MRKTLRFFSIIICITPILVIGIIGGLIQTFRQAWEASVFYFQTGKFRA